MGTLNPSRRSNSAPLVSLEPRGFLCLTGKMKTKQDPDSLLSKILLLWVCVQLFLQIHIYASVLGLAEKVFFLFILRKNNTSLLFVKSHKTGSFYTCEHWCRRGFQAVLPNLFS